MQKLLFVINQFYKGGAETSLLNLLKFLDKSKYEIDLMVLNQVPVKNATSLMEQVPTEVHIFDAYEEEQKKSLIDRIRAKHLLKAEDLAYIPASALLYVKNKKYDWAFHVGEWWSPRFVAKCVTADAKCAWMHNDLSEAEYFNADVFFGFDNEYYRYIFVSQNSMQASCKKYPFLEKKSICIYNISDSEDIISKSADEFTENYGELPVVLTCANIRLQKNHSRALEAMGLLKKRGVDFLWLNIGATTETERCQKLIHRALELGLDQRFILAGPKANPYPYMKWAHVVAVLSDYESWSMVITEAKILGKPIIATKTSGALEQLEDRKTGILTDFDAKDIADKLEELITSETLRKELQNNLKGFDNREEVLRSFEALLSEKEAAPQKELLYIIDDINYLGGAHIATKLQIRELLKKGRNIAVFSNTVPNVSIRNELSGVRFVSWSEFPEDVLYHRRLLDCLLDPTLSRERKKLKWQMSWRGKVRNDANTFEDLVMPHISKLFSGYKTVCVMSEGSTLRKYVAQADSERKVQWIHIDYAAWIGQTDWAKNITKDDGAIYKKFDKIVVLSHSIRRKFVAIYPHLENKVVVNKNIIPVDEIIEKSAEKRNNYRRLSFVTVCRIDYQKGVDRLFRVLVKLYSDGYRFQWTFIGDGNDYESTKQLFRNSVLKYDVKFTGALSNPFPHVKSADVFALLSNFEGLPNTIYEALILGTPVLATDVGGVSTQIEDGKTGWLVENEEKEIYKKLEYVMSHPEEAAQMRENLKNYVYDNDAILAKAEEILFPSEFKS